MVTDLFSYFREILILGFSYFRERSVYQSRHAKLANETSTLTQCKPKIIFRYHRWATLCKKHGNHWNSSIFLHLSASAIGSGSGKCHVQELSSGLSKKQGFAGGRVPNVAFKKSKIKDSKIAELFEQLFSLLAIHEYFHDGFWKPRKSAQKVIRILVEVRAKMTEDIAPSLIWSRPGIVVQKSSTYADRPFDPCHLLPPKYRRSWLPLFPTYFFFPEKGPPPPGGWGGRPAALGARKREPHDG